MSDYEAMLEQYYRSVLKAGDVCVDIGAHLGRHALPIARAIGRSGHVHAFEPLPAINARLRATAAASGGAPITVYDCALGVERGTADFVSVAELPEYSGLKARVYDSQVTTETIRIPIERLDDVLAATPRLDYIKVDAEGGEYGALRGGDALVRRFRPIITFEFGDNSLINYAHTSADMYDMLDGWGYRIEDIRRRPLGRAQFIDSSARQEVWDYIATPR